VQMRLSRAYGRVNRASLRDHLLSRCRAHGVHYVPDTLVGVDNAPGAARATARTASGAAIAARLVTLAGGAASGKFLCFEDDAPPVASQTAYGITAEVEGYGGAYDTDAMLFMDYRRTHSGMWDGTGAVLTRNMRRGEVNHPNWNANFGSCAEAPSFLYAMPLENGQVFLEETCLVARPTLPFSELERRLYRRCGAMGIKITKVRDARLWLLC
jgi:lycopene epsilon-cyclase